MLDGDDERSLKGLGYLYFDAKMYEEAIDYWEDLLKKKKALNSDKQILILIGNCYRKEGQFKNKDQCWKRFDKSMEE